MCHVGRNIVPCYKKKYSLGCISLTTSIACTFQGVAQIFEVGRGWFVVSKRYITSLVSIRYLSMKHSFRPPLRWGQMQHKIKQNNGTYQYFCVHVFLISQLNYKKTTKKKKEKEIDKTWKSTGQVDFPARQVAFYWLAQWARAQASRLLTKEKM